MISTSFDYKRATSVEDVLADLNEDSKILAGGHSLIPAMKLRLNQTGLLIDITKIESLKQITFSQGTLHIGAAATHQQISLNQDVLTHAPLMAEVAGLIGDVQVRNAGTIGGSIAHADPAADWPAALLAADATILVKSQSGERSILIRDFFTGIYSTDLQENEIIIEVQVPSMKSKRANYQKFAQPASRFALVGCAASGTVNGSIVSDLRVAFTGLSDVPFLDQSVQKELEGKTLNDASIADAVRSMDKDVYVMEDHYADETYRKHLAGIMLSRALKSMV
ncbi:UNVERIFIED_CONTAM: hypothetical protein GTU68_043917 [Idotea baltica]|nr:hypothetical protein [Idotea baltica]